MKYFLILYILFTHLTNAIALSPSHTTSYNILSGFYSSENLDLRDEFKQKGFINRFLIDWENSLALTADKLRKDRAKLILLLQSGNSEAHTLFRYFLSKEVVKTLIDFENGIRGVWVIGTVDNGTCGLASDIDYLIEVGNLNERKRIEFYIEVLNKFFSFVYQEILQGRFEIDGLIDISDKIFLSDELNSSSGNKFTQMINSPYYLSSQIYLNKSTIPEHIPIQANLIPAQISA